MNGHRTARGSAPSAGWSRSSRRLFHDSGYIRETGESAIANGAVFTRNHVTRSARFIARYLPDAGLGHWVPISTRIVHFTGYEVPLDLLRVADVRDRLAGHLLGTADMLAQMADRCYLEKCRDRLYAEFVLGDVAVHAGAEGVKVLYGSGLDLLRQTPKFIASTIDNRLGTAFGHSYRYVEPLYGGDNPYMNAIHQNVQYLNGLTRGSRWPMLRRNPPVFTVESNAMDGVRTLLVRHLKEVFGAPQPPSARTDAREARAHARRRVHVEHVALANHGAAAPGSPPRHRCPRR